MLIENEAFTGSAFCQKPCEGLNILPMGGAGPILVFNATTNAIVTAALMTNGMMRIEQSELEWSENKDKTIQKASQYFHGEKFNARQRLHLQP
jgi:hypothetical protein